MPFGNHRESKVRKLSEYERGFIVAAIDGEGTIGIHKKIYKQKYVWGKKVRKRKGYEQYKPLIGIYNTNKSWLIQIKKIIGCGYLTGIKPNIEKNKRAYWRFHIENLMDIKVLLLQIIDYLIVKKSQAKILLEYCSLRLDKITLHPKRMDLARYGDEEKELYEKIVELNKKGLKRKQ